MAKKKTPDADVIVADDDDDMLDLSTDEKETCQNVLVFGIEYLQTAKGYSKRQVRDFLNRPEVQREIGILKRQYEDRSGIQERTQFFAQLKVNSMVPAALNVLARGLAGPRKQADGTVIPPPTKAQIEAANEILVKANIQGGKWAGNDHTPNIDARSVNIAIGGGEGIDASQLGTEGRERLRTLVNRILARSGAGAQAAAMIEKRKDRDDGEG